MAFVLAGGGSHGAAQVGMLRAFVDAGVLPDLVVGTSVGAINGLFFAAIPTADGVNRLWDVWRNVSRRDVYPASAGTVLRALTVRGDHLVPSSRFRALLTRHLPVTRVEHTVIPCAIVAADAIDGTDVIFTEGSAVDAVLGSASLPVLLPAVPIGDRLVMDGAVARNTAITVALARGARRVVVLPTGFACAAKRPRGVVGAGLHVVSMLLSRQLAAEVERHGATTAISVVPPLCPMPVSSYDFSRATWMMEQAFESTSAWLAAGGLDAHEIPPTLEPHRHS